MYEVNGILYAGDPAPMIKVVDVQPLPDYCLRLTFSDGAVKEYDAKPLLHLPVFRPLRDKALFEAVRVDFDTVTWCDGDLDIAPETLYQEARELIASERE